MKPASGTRKPYTGTSRSLVLALDIGTTFSGVSYAILEPGEVPKIHGVTRFPGQEHVAGNSKIPSIMYYDRHGEMKAAGAEADGASVLAQAEDEGWIKTELFKLRLRPRTMALKMNGMRLSALPRGKSAVEVFGDFLKYLFRCTRSFIIDTHANGQALWHAVEHDLQLVLSHPNGWEGAQQTKMRRAAVYGGLISDSDEGKARIRFVTEGEASLHACVLNGLAADVLSSPSGHGFIVADAGGGTLDISTYAIRATAPLVIEEIAPPDCVFAGSVFVSRRARALFEEKLKNSKYGTPDSLEHITKKFDETTKRLFRTNKEPQFVPFGSPLDRDLAAGIRGGQLKLTGLEVAALFEPSVQAAIASIKAQIQASAGQVRSVWLVGGFAASPWLFSQLQEHLTPLGVIVSRPDTQTSKAVADGAVGFYCDHHVSARMSKFMYGVEYLREYDGSDEDHIARKHRLFELPSGPKLLPDAFDCILARSVKVKESTVFSRKYCTEVTNLTTLSVFEVEIWCYRGGDTVPKWILRDADHFSTLCYVRADLSPLAGSAQPKQGRNGKTYWTIVFSIEIHFGLTEFRARIKWTDNGKTRYGPASIVYNESGHRAEEDEPDVLPDDEPNVYSHPHSEKLKSHSSSRAPSRDPAPSSSRSVSHSSHSPQIDFPSSKSVASVASTRRPSIDGGRIYDYDRKPSLTSRPDEVNWRERESGSRAGSIMDKGKERDRSIPPESPRMTDRISEKDRLANLSARSTDSKTSVRTNATAKLSEQLTSIWGDAPASSMPSKQPTPSPSPRVEPSHFDAPTPRERPSSIYSNSASTYRETKPPSPQIHAKSPVPSAPMSIASKMVTPAPASKTVTPQAVSKSITPAATPKFSTPQPPPATLAPAAPVALSWGSKMATPLSSSRVASKAGSKAPTPLATSRVVTPRTMSKVNTPTAERSDPWGSGSGAATDGGITPRAPTPEIEPVIPTPVEEPTAPIGPQSWPARPKSTTSKGGASKVPSPRDANSKLPSPQMSTSKVPSPKMVGSKVPSPKLHEQHVEAPRDTSTDFLDQSHHSPLRNSLLDEVTVNNATTADDAWGDSSGKFDWGGDSSKKGMDDLWEADKHADTGGGFSEFLTSGGSTNDGKWSPTGLSKNNSESGEKREDKPATLASSLGFGSWGGASGTASGPALGGLTSTLGGWSNAKSAVTSVFGAVTDSVGLSSTPDVTPAAENISKSPKPPAPPKLAAAEPAKPTPKPEPAPLPPVETAPVAKVPSWGVKPKSKGFGMSSLGWGGGSAFGSAPSAFGSTPSAFGGTTSAFGSTPSAFGSTSVFGDAGSTPAEEAEEEKEKEKKEKEKKEKEEKEKEEKEKEKEKERVEREKKEQEEREKKEEEEREKKEKDEAEKAKAEADEMKAKEEAAEVEKARAEALKLDTTPGVLNAAENADDPPPSTAVETAVAEPDFPVHMSSAQKKKLKQQQNKEKKEREEREKMERKEEEEREKRQQEELLAKDLADNAPQSAEVSAEAAAPPTETPAADALPDGKEGDADADGGDDEENSNAISRAASGAPATGGGNKKKKKKKGK